MRGATKLACIVGLVAACGDRRTVTIEPGVVVVDWYQESGSALALGPPIASQIGVPLGDGTIVKLAVTAQLAGFVAVVRATTTAKTDRVLEQGTCVWNSDVTCSFGGVGGGSFKVCKDGHPVSATTKCKEIR